MKELQLCTRYGKLHILLGTIAVYGIKLLQERLLYPQQLTVPCGVHAETSLFVLKQSIY